ncbi:MAG: hypothetical protein E6X14_03590 [Clostridium celatum]|nr:hypothetical protein [Clostridium celatum]
MYQDKLKENMAYLFSLDILIELNSTLNINSNIYDDEMKDDAMILIELS